MKTEDNMIAGWENADWEKITENHADEEVSSGRADVRAAADNPDKLKRELFADFYEKQYARRKDRVAVMAARYAILAVGLAAIGWAIRDMAWLSITIAAIATVFGLLSAYGIGKYQQM